MTIDIHALVVHIPPGKGLQIVRRFPATGNETVIAPDVAMGALERHHLWAECELVFREVDASVEPVEPDAPLSAEG